MSKLMMTAEEVAEIMDCSKDQGYTIIRRLNQELEDKGYLIRRGRIPRKYFFERTGLAPEEVTTNAQTGA